MASTVRTTLSRYFPGFARRDTAGSTNPLERERAVTTVSLSASSTVDQVVYCSDGPAYVRAIYFVPDTAVTASGSAYWTVTVNKNSSTGAQTSLGTFDSKLGFTQYARSSVFTFAVNQVIEDGQNLSLAFVKTSTPENFSGRLVVSYIPIEV